MSARLLGEGASAVTDRSVLQPQSFRRNSPGSLAKFAAMRRASSLITQMTPVSASLSIACWSRYKSTLQASRVWQSMLTGESVPVEIEVGNTTYAGGLVRRGEATAKVVATGSRTYFGRTAELVSVAHVERAEGSAERSSQSDRDQFRHRGRKS